MKEKFLNFVMSMNDLNEQDVLKNFNDILVENMFN